MPTHNAGGELVTRRTVSDNAAAFFERPGPTFHKPRAVVGPKTHDLLVRPGRFRTVYETRCGRWSVTRHRDTQRWIVSPGAVDREPFDTFEAAASFVARQLGVSS